MLVDANILLFAVDSASPFYPRASGWLTERLNGVQRLGFPWHCLVAFTRIATNPRASDHPLKPNRAWGYVEDWLASEPSWIPEPTDRHREVLGGLIEKYQLAGNMISDAHLAALAVEHGLVVASADTDFARFTEVRWENPLA